MSGLLGFQPEAIARVAGQWIGKDDLPLCPVDAMRVRELENGPGSVDMGLYLPGLRSSCRRLPGTIGKIYGVLQPVGCSRFSLRQAARAAEEDGMPPQVIALGELLVEVMRKDVISPSRNRKSLWGPIPAAHPLSLPTLWLV